MKKSFFVLLFFFAATNTVLENPILIPPAYLSEFTFDLNNKWIMEIDFSFVYGGYLAKNYDSICVVSTEGISKIRMENVKDSAFILVINSDSLFSPLTINKNGDIVKLIFYPSKDASLYFEPDSLTFGNCPGSLIDSIPSGYSLCRYGYNDICLCSKPTIGSSNSIDGNYFTLKGHIFNKRGFPITKGRLRFDEYLDIYDDGTYSTKLFVRKLDLHFLLGYYMIEYYSIEPFSLNVCADTVVEHDIYVLDEIMGIEKNGMPESEEIDVINYPNPFNLSTNFFVKIPSSLQQKEGSIVIYNVTGRKIKTIPITNGSFIKWNGDDTYGGVVTSGVYYYQLEIDKKNYKSGSMILLK
ncbi:MAG: T9SS type A sorting domain-containing protein [Ignavibacteriaceae bacterium]|jgi:hypothetical protein